MSQAAFKLSKKIPQLIEKVRDIITRLIANIAVYATPNPSAATLTTLTDNAEASYQSAINGGKDKKVQMKLDEKILRNNMTGLLGYIQTTSGGDAAKINLVADVKKPPSPVGLLPPPSNMRSDFGEHTGEIIFRWKGVKGRAMYSMQINDTPGDDTKWVNAGFTGKTTYIATGLTSGKDYTFRVATISTAGISGWSELASHKAS